MRTTITIDDGLLADVKGQATRRGISVSQFIEEAVRLCLARASPPAERKPVKIITYGRPGDPWPAQADRVNELLHDDDVANFRRLAAQDHPSASDAHPDPGDAER